MSQADYAYCMRRADEEQANAEHAATVEARAAHEKLHELYLIQIDRVIDEPAKALYHERA